MNATQETEHIQKLERRARLVDAAGKLVWLDRNTAAAYMGIGTTHLDILIKQRSIPASKLGGRVLLRRQDIDEYLKQCSPATSNKP
ncbi:MAG: excisionase family DNA-binding protein [Verrucomicrobiae bacterium]|nr:excisionase family DNA-binding protein [Verrucomicrobiae bacterium]